MDTQTTEAEMDDMITVGSNATAADPGYMDTPDEEEGIVALDTQTTFGEQSEAPTGETHDEGEDPAPTAKGKRKPASSSTAEPRIKWATKEDEVKKSYEERRMLDPEFALCVLDRGEKAMANHWAAIQQACNKWHGIQEEVRNQTQSGSNVEQRVMVFSGISFPPFAVVLLCRFAFHLSLQMVHMFDMYRRDNNDAEFKFLHVFTRIESCEKWKEVRLALAKTKDGVYNPNAPTNPASAGRLEGNKKAKAGAPAAERVQAAIEQCIADAKEQALAKQQMNAEREEKANARWAVLMKKSDIKIELLKTNVAAKKRMTDLAFLQAGDPATMTPQVASWYRAECGKILNGMSAAPSADEDDSQAEDGAQAEDDAQPPPSTTIVEDEHTPSPTAADENPAPAPPSATALVDV
ncbi:unnamed protein product [Alopecurus aequalis]